MELFSQTGKLTYKLVLHNVICFEHNVYKLSNGRNGFQTRGLGIARRYCKAESTSSHLAGVATIADLFCWVPCQEFVLIIYHVMSIFSVHIY